MCKVHKMNHFFFLFVVNKGLEPPSNKSLYSPGTNSPTWSGGNACDETSVCINIYILYLNYLQLYLPTQFMGSSLFST